ncbi:MAG TPA: 50S ribosomal protein L4 [Planctomycetota bacterium]|nr:50S ribosomal protein L4 [Planctomycetota bacterium]
MATVKTYSGSAHGSLEVDAKVFAPKVLGRTLKEAVVMYEANKRQGTHSARERSEVAGSQKKMYKQKHTGRARAGDIRSPLRRGGGTVHAPKPRDYSFKMPKKQRRVALASAIFGKLSDGEVFVVDGLPTQEIKTKAAYAVLAAVGVESSSLVVTDGVEPKLVRSLRNVPSVSVLPVADLNAHTVLLHKNLVFTPTAFDKLMARPWSQKSRRAVSGAEAG